MKLTRQLSLFDSICLIITVTVGVGIYQFLPDVARGCDSGSWLLAIWVIGGFLSLCGALGYAELASALPRSGGDYVYLNEAYGDWAGFLFGWTLTLVVRPGDIAIMAFAFALYFKTFFDPLSGTAWADMTTPIYAAAAILTLTAVHALGVREGKWANNCLALLKVLGIGVIITIAFCCPAAGDTSQVQQSSFPPAIAMLFVLFCFGGWNEIAYVAAEVKKPGRNLVRSIALSVTGITVIYLLLTGSLWHSLGFEGIRQSEAVVTTAIEGPFPGTAKSLIATLISISALGATSGMIFAGARVSQALGEDHLVFRPLKKINPRLKTPLRALLLQALIACLLIVILGSHVEMIIYTSPVLYLFFIATNLAVIVLRFRQPELPRPYRVTAYPLPILVFAAVCLFLLYETISYKPILACCGYGVMLLGLIAFAIEQKFSRPKTGQ
jgi:basic amino acid/polyamine antiporter, APA family